MTTPVEIAIIRRAREIISDPGKWTQGASARDENGKVVRSISDSARVWCGYGALIVAAKEQDHDDPDIGIAYDIVTSLVPEVAEVGLALFTDINDGPNGHAAVLSLFDKALAAEPAP